MKNLELNQMEIIQGGNECAGAIVTAGIGISSILAAGILGGPIGLSIACAGFMWGVFSNQGACS